MFSEDHLLTSARALAKCRKASQAWVALQAESASAGARQLSRTSGRHDGCSSPHLHGPGLGHRPLLTRSKAEDRPVRPFIRLGRKSRCSDYAQLEVQSGECIVELNEHWPAVAVPAAWPFETLVLPRVRMRPA